MKRPVKNLPDTNTIVRYLVKDDIVLYEKSKTFFDKVKSGNIRAVILESVIVECIYVLTKVYKVPKDKAADSLMDILHYRGVANNDRDELIEALAIFSENPSIYIVDCVLCSKARNSDMPLFTFDKALIGYSKRP